MTVNKSMFEKVTKDFWNYELLPPEFFTGISVSPNWYLSEFLLTIPQAFRDFTGKPVTINNWATGGTLLNRGVRLPDCNTGTKLSMHKFSNAIDINIEGLSQLDVLEIVKKNRDKFKLITTYEDLNFTKGWNHFDGRYTQKDTLLMVRP